MRDLSPKASSRLACAPRHRRVKGKRVDTNLGSILKVRERSSALLYHTLLDPVLPESCDDIRHPPSPLLSFGNFRTRSAASGPASATSRTSATSELAPFLLRADAEKSPNVEAGCDWFSAPRLSARVRPGAGPGPVREAGPESAGRGGAGPGASLGSVSLNRFGLGPPKWPCAKLFKVVEAARPHHRSGGREGRQAQGHLLKLLFFVCSFSLPSTIVVRVHPEFFSSVSQSIQV